MVRRAGFNDRLPHFGQLNANLRHESTISNLRDNPKSYILSAKHQATVPVRVALPLLSALLPLRQASPDPEICKRGALFLVGNIGVGRR